MRADNWTPCDSQSDLEMRMSSVDADALSPTISDEANRWGFVSLKFERNILIPIGYSNVGLTPAVEQSEHAIFIGVSETIASYDKATGQKLFEFRMPTVFHEFILFDCDGLVARDETGFVRLSFDGQKVWEHLYDDTIASFEICGGEVLGTTTGGEEFRFGVN